MPELRILYLDNRPDVVRAVHRALQQAGYMTTVHTDPAPNGAALRAVLAEQPWDLVLCAERLASHGGLDLVREIRRAAADAGLVVICSAVGEEGAVALVRAGADDIVRVDKLEGLAAAVVRALDDARERQWRRAATVTAEEESRVSGALARVAKACIAGVDTDALLQRVCHVTAEVLDCEYSYAVLWDAKAGVFAPLAGYDDPRHFERVSALRFPLPPTGPATAVAADAEVAVDTAGLTGETVRGALDAAAEASASLHIPLRRAQELIGIQVVGQRRRGPGFTSWQRRAAVAIGHHISLALDNAYLVERLTHSDRVKSQFLAAVSHELRTPLHHIIGFDDILLEGAAQFSSGQIEAMHTIRRSALDLLALVNRVLDVQRLEADALASEPQSVDVAALLRVIASTTARLLEGGPVHVVCALPPHLPSLNVDPVQLKVILQNLVDNAVKFTARGTITIGAEAHSNGVLLSITDTGIGIRSDSQRIIFAAFRQGDGTAPSKGGVGLGLYTVKRLVDLLGGDVRVESELGSGSTFRVWLPCQPHAPTRPADSRELGLDYANLLDGSSDLVHIAAPDGRFMYANRAWREALGYGEDEIPSLSIHDVVHPESRTALLQARARAMEGQILRDVKTKFLTKDGRSIELQGTVSAGFANGVPLCTQSVLQNVSERTAAQRQAEERRRLLEAVMDALPVGVFLVDKTGRITHTNPAAVRIWGGARYVGVDEYDQYKAWLASNGARLQADDWPAVAAIREGRTTIEQEIEIECFDGPRKIILNSAIPLAGADGGIAGAIIVNHDITERRLAEARLQQSEERFRALVDNSADGILVHDMAGTLIEVNRAACTALDFSREDIIGRPLADIDMQLDAERVLQLLHSLESGEAVVHETLLRRRDGSTFPAEIRSVMFNRNGQPHVLGTTRDVTQHKHDEEILRAAKEQLEFMIEHAGVGFWTWDLRTNVSDYSLSWRRQFGYEDGDLPADSNLWWDLLDPEDRTAVARALQEVMNGARRYETELRIRHKNGTYRNVLSRAAVIRDDDGTPIRLLGAHIDITESKREPSPPAPREFRQTSLADIREQATKRSA